MKRTSLLLLILAALSSVSGYLLSKASVVGKIGISMFYKEYRFLKVWWKGAAVVFGALLILAIIQGFIQQRTSPKTSVTLHILCILLAITGLYFTYNDFRHDLSHRLLGERFHVGAYLFWIGWIVVSLFYLIQGKPVQKFKEAV